MKISTTTSIKGINALFLPLENLKIPTKLKELLPTTVNNELKKATKEIFNGKAGKTLHLLTETQIYLIGTSDLKKFSERKIQKLASKIAEITSQNKFKNIAVATQHLPNEIENIEQLTENIILSSYKYDTYITESDKLQFKSNSLKFLTKNKSKVLKTAIEHGQTVAEGVNYTRDLVNAPAIHCTPTQLASEAKEIAKLSKNIKTKVYSKKELEKIGMNLILGVSSGSGQEPKLIKLEYKNKPKNKKPILVVGKGVTFDAGGLNIKLTGNIDSMKFDMAGAGTILGLFRLLAKSDPNLHVIGLIPTVENLVGDHAYKPGDILTGYNGKTVEITNTDAEGRLILADALAYGTEKFKPEAVVDLATLTGACITALGYTRTGVVSNNKELYKKFKKASKTSGNKIWRLPLDKFHRKKVEGSISDYKNYTGGIGAGATMAAAFLEKFTNKNPWVHMDIAGTAFLDKSVNGKPKGATGETVKLLYHFLLDY